MRYLAIDLGDKRTGLALGDEETGIVTPLDVVELDRRALGEAKYAEALAALVRDHLGPSPAGASRRSPGEVVIGLPLNMDASEGPPAAGARALASELRARSGRTVHLFDERLTSAEAEWALDGSGLTRGQKRARRDALAAAAILREFLRSRTRPSVE